MDSTGHGYQEASQVTLRFGQGACHRSRAPQAGHVRLGDGQRRGARDDASPQVVPARRQEALPQGLAPQPFQPSPLVGRLNRLPLAAGRHVAICGELCPASELVQQSLKRRR